MASTGRGGPGRGVTARGGGWRPSSSRQPAMVYFRSGNEALDDPWERYLQLRRFLWSYTVALRIADDVWEATIAAVIRREDRGVERLAEAQTAWEFAMAEYTAACTCFEPH